VSAADGLGELVEGHVVEEDRVDAGGEGRRSLSIRWERATSRHSILIQESYFTALRDQLQMGRFSAMIHLCL
jgi:hypothetical protein